MSRKLLLSFFVFLVGSAYAAESSKENSQRKRSLNPSPESEFSLSRFNKKLKGSPSSIFLEDKSVSASNKLLGLCQAAEAQFLPKQILIETNFNQKKFIIPAAHPKSPLMRNKVSSVTSATDKIDPELAKWRKAFFSAIQADDADRLRSLHAEVEDVNFRIYSPVNPELFTYPLHFALRHDLRQAASYLIEEGLYDPRAKDSFDHTVLSLTIELGNYRNFKELLDTADLDLRVRDRLYLTHFAASQDTISPIYLKALQTKGANFLKLCEKRGWTVLQYAVAANNSVLVNWLNESSPCGVTLKDNQRIILDALAEEHENLVIQLIQMGAEIRVEDGNNRNIFHFIAEYNFFDVLQYIEIDSKSLEKMLETADRVKGYCPAHYAAEYDNVDILLWIYNNHNLSYKTKDGTSIIKLAIKSGSAEVVRAMIEEQLFDNTESFGSEDPPIVAYAYVSGNREVTETVLELWDQGSLEVCDENGLNALHHSVRKNDLEFVKILVDQYKFDAFYSSGLDDIPTNSPFSWAIYLQNVEIVEYFLKDVEGKYPDELVNIAYFFDNEPNTDIDPNDETNCFEILQLAEIFGGDQVLEIIKKYHQ